MKRFRSSSLGGIAHITAVLVALIFAGPMGAGAEIATWEARGILTEVSTGGGFIEEFPDAAVGQPFLLTVVFDTARPVSQTDSEEDLFIWFGTRYRYFDALVSLTLEVNGVTLERSIARHFLDIWDNFAIAGSTPCGSAEAVCDGFLALAVLESSGPVDAFLNLVLRGHERLDIYSGPGLPDTPSPLLMKLSSRFMQFGDNGDGLVGLVESLSLSVASPRDLLADLIAVVLDLNLKSGTGNALDAKLQNALAALDRAESGDTPAAIGIMYAFIHSVEAQRGKELSEAQADALIAAAEAVIAALERT